MKNKIRFISQIIFFGALWGIAEASVGYILHIIPGVSTFVSGAIMFSFASIILYKAYQRTNSKTSLLYIGMIAAAIKAVDFFLPFGSPFKIVNPMISIILESMAVFAVITLLDKDDLASKVKGVLIGSVAWRALFFAYMGVQYLSSGYVYLHGAMEYLNFFLIYAFASSALAFGFLWLDKLIQSKFRNLNKLSLINPIVSLVSLALAVILTILT